MTFWRFTEFSGGQIFTQHTEDMHFLVCQLWCAILEQHLSTHTKHNQHSTILLVCARPNCFQKKGGLSLGWPRLPGFILQNNLYTAHCYKSVILKFWLTGLLLSLSTTYSETQTFTITAFHDCFSKLHLGLEAWSLRAVSLGFFFHFFFVGWRVGVGVVSSSTVQGTIAYLMHDIQDMASSLRVVCLSSYGIGAAGAHRCLQRVQQGFAITTHLNKTQHFAVTVSQLQPVLFTC